MSIQSLKVQRDIIALEAYSITDASTLLTTHLPKMVMSFKNSLSFLKPNDRSVKLTKDQKSFLRTIEQRNYLDMVGFTIDVPEGFKGSFKDYSEDLKIVSEDANRIMDTLLKPYAEYLAKLISTKEHKFDTTNFFSHLNKDGSKRLANFEVMNKYLSHKTPNTSTYGEVIERNADWDTILRNVSLIERNLNNVKREDLIKKSQEISKYLEVIITRIQNNEYKDISPEVVRSLAEGVFQAASELERFTVVYYNTLVYFECINRIMDKFNKK